MVTGHIYAGTQGHTSGVCSLFRPEEMALLEWVTDVSLLESLAWGSHINYAIAAPLLQDLRNSLQVGHACRAVTFNQRGEAMGAMGIVNCGECDMLLFYAHCLLSVADVPHVIQL